MKNAKSRGAFLAAGLVTLVLGIGSRNYSSHIPTFFAQHAGDALWAAFAYCGISVCFPTTRIATRAALAIGFAFSIEVSQLYHAPWIDSLRATRIGGLILGFGFLWIDLVRYTAGVLAFAVIEWMLSRSVDRGLE